MALCLCVEVYTTLLSYCPQVVTIGGGSEQMPRLKEDFQKQEQQRLEDRVSPSNVLYTQPYHS